MSKMLPTLYFPHNDDVSKHLIGKCKTAGYNVTTEKPNWMKWNTFFYITHDLIAYGEYKEPYDLSHFICIVMYHFLIDDEKDHRLIENFFGAFFQDREFYFPRSGGLLKHFLCPQQE